MLREVSMWFVKGDRKEAMKEGWKQDYGNTAPSPSPNLKQYVVQCEIAWQYEHNQCMCKIQEC